LDLAVADWDWAASVVVDLVVAVVASTSTCISNHAQRAEKPRTQWFGAFSVARTRVHCNSIRQRSSSKLDESRGTLLPLARAW
jgi:hypothetical protein